MERGTASSRRWALITLQSAAKPISWNGRDGAGSWWSRCPRSASCFADSGLTAPSSNVPWVLRNSAASSCSTWAGSLMRSPDCRPLKGRVSWRSPLNFAPWTRFCGNATRQPQSQSLDSAAGGRSTSPRSQSSESSPTERHNAAISRLSADGTRPPCSLTVRQIRASRRAFSGS